MTIEGTSNPTRLPQESASRRGWLRPLSPESDAMLHFDMLRFVAATGIVWHHSHEFLVPAAARADLAERTQALALFVDLFFAISGYVIAFVYAERMGDVSGYRRFLQRRIGRLLPLHWLTLALSFLLWTAVAWFGLAADNMPDRSAACVIQTAFLLNGLFPCGNGVMLNGVTWSISTEMALYVLFPVFLAATRFRLLAFVASVALVLALVRMEDGRWDMLHPLVRAVPSFLFGMLLFRVRERLPILSRSWLVPAFTAVLLVMMVTGVEQFVVLAMVYLVVLAAVSADRARHASPVIRRAAALGQLTYGIYMWHMLFIVVLLNAIGDKALGLSSKPMAFLVLICYLLIVTWSFFSLRLFENPARRWIDRL